MKLKFTFNGDINKSISIHIYKVKGIEEFSKIKRYRDGREKDLRWQGKAGMREKLNFPEEYPSFREIAASQ